MAVITGIEACQGGIYAVKRGILQIEYKQGFLPLQCGVWSVMKIKLRAGVLACVLGICIFAAAGGICTKVYAKSSAEVSGDCFAEISGAVLRLHVRADDDSTKAQAVKFLVRDAIIDVMKNYDYEMDDKASALKAVSAHFDELKKAAEAVLLSEGCSYGVDIKLERAWFPQKRYGDVCLPQGCYDAVVVRLGRGEGENWWCVLFPKLCFVAPENGIVPESSKAELKASLSGEAYDAIVTPRLKIVEWFEKIW